MVDDIITLFYIASKVNMFISILFVNYYIVQKKGSTIFIVLHDRAVFHLHNII